MKLSLNRESQVLQSGYLMLYGLLLARVSGYSLFHHFPHFSKLAFVQVERVPRKNSDQLKLTIEATHNLVLSLQEKR